MWTPFLILQDYLLLLLILFAWDNLFNVILFCKIRNGVDPAGIAPASPDVKADMLTRYNTGPDPQVYSTTKKALLQELFLLTSDL